MIYGFANVFSRVFAMILIPLYAKYLGKIDYSNLVMLQLVFTILTFLLALNTGVFYYYYQHENNKYRKIVFTTWFYYELVLSVLLIGLAYLFSTDIINQILIVNNGNSADLTLCLVLLSLQLLPYTINNTNINLFRINRKPQKVVLIVFFESVFTFSFIFISLNYLKWGLVGVTLSQLVARTMISLSFSKTAFFYALPKFFSIKLLKKIVFYTWPYFVISIFSWVITSIDKFIAGKTIVDKTDVAILALAMQLVIPISVLADMIRMALGPFVMSIHKDEDAKDTYQKVFDLTLFTSSMVVIFLVAGTPILTLLLTDKSFLPVTHVVPLMAFASVFSLVANQFSISFNLARKNIYILYATVAAGVIDIVCNYFFLADWGIIVSGLSQLLSYLVMAMILYFAGIKVAKLDINLKNGSIILGILFTFIIVNSLNQTQIMNGNYWMLFTYTFITLIILSLTYIKLQNINVKGILNKFLKR